MPEIETIPESELENGYYWAIRNDSDDVTKKEPVWVGFIKGKPRVWAIGNRYGVSPISYQILEKIE